jgi:PAS domain-containing protein
MIGLLLAFGAAYKLTDASGINSSVPETALALMALAALGASYASVIARRLLRPIVDGLCYLTSFWFIGLAWANDFEPNYAVGLLFIIPGLGVAHSLNLRGPVPLGMFFTLNVGVASTACILSSAGAVTPILLIASLLCISLVTMFVAGSRLQAQRRCHATEQRCEAVVGQASDGIYMLDARTLRFLDANRAFCDMVGMGIEQLQRMSVGELVVTTS